jgi:hypothetical protein
MHKEASSGDIGVLRALLERLRRMTKETKEQLAGIIQILANEWWTPSAPLKGENSGEASNSETTESPHEHATEQSVDVIERSIEVEDTAELAEANRGGAEESMAIEPAISASGGVVDQLTNVDDCSPDVGVVAAIAEPQAEISQPVETPSGTEPVAPNRNDDAQATGVGMCRLDAERKENSPDAAPQVVIATMTCQSAKEVDDESSIDKYVNPNGWLDVRRIAAVISESLLSSKARESLRNECIKRLDSGPVRFIIYDGDTYTEVGCIRRAFEKSQAPQ